MATYTIAATRTGQGQNALWHYFALPPADAAWNSHIVYGQAPDGSGPIVGAALTLTADGTVIALWGAPLPPQGGSLDVSD